MRLGFGVDAKMHFFDIRVFHPNTPSYLKTQPASLFQRHELEKKREYGNRIRSMECGREATKLIFYSHLADLLSKKQAHPIPRHFH